MNSRCISKWTACPCSLLVAAIFGGCTFNEPKGFNSVYSDVRSDPHPGFIVERGKSQKVYEASASVFFFGLLWPFPADGSSTSKFLFYHPLAWWEAWRFTNLGSMPEWRSSRALFELAEVVAPPQRDSSGQPRDMPVHWIISANPFVLATGTDLHTPTMEDRWGESIILPGSLPEYGIPTAGDLDRTTTELLVLDSWPPPGHGTGQVVQWSSEQEEQFIAEMAKKVRRISLEEPKSLREIMAQRPWLVPASAQ